MHAIMETIYVALLENDFTMRSLTFANFVSVWLLHLVDPSGSHPRVTLRYVIITLNSYNLKCAYQTSVTGGCTSSIQNTA